MSYRSRSKNSIKPFRLHPAGLVSRHAISYLIATVGEYSDLRQFALHRIQQIEMLSEPAEFHSSFDVDDYIASGVFHLRQADHHVELIADVHPQIATLLHETPLSLQQDLSDIHSEDWKRLRAKVPLDRETLWWIFALNDNIRVHAPQVWVDEIRKRLRSMQSFYLQASPA